MATLLKNMKISHISLVGAAANKRTFVYKSAGAAGRGEEVKISLSNLCKSLDHHMVYGVVYSPDEIDTQCEYSTADEIEKAAHEFLADLNQRNVDVEHSFKPEGAYVAESWLLKGQDERFPGAPEGSWAVGIKITDEALWKSVKDGTVSGLSMAGVAEKVREEDDRTFAKSLFAALADLVKGTAANNKGTGTRECPKQEDEEHMTEELSKAVSAAVTEALKPLNDKVEKMERRLESVEKSRGSSQKPIDGALDDELEGVL